MKYLGNTFRALIVFLVGANICLAENPNCHEYLRTVAGSIPNLTDLWDGNQAQIKNRLQLLLGQSLTPDQIKDIRATHLAGGRPEGANGTFTFGQLKLKAQILKNAGFNAGQIRRLMESHAVGLMDAIGGVGQVVEGAKWGYDVGQGNYGKAMVDAVMINAFGGVHSPTQSVSQPEVRYPRTTGSTSPAISEKDKAELNRQREADKSAAFANV